jgi:hypothetical protein
MFRFQPNVKLGKGSPIFTSVIGVYHAIFIGINKADIAGLRTGLCWCCCNFGSVLEQAIGFITVEISRRLAFLKHGNRLRLAVEETATQDACGTISVGSRYHVFDSGNVERVVQFKAVPMVSL